jgi:23S rRNA (cytidine1920-2'-O)/16S rRNA (cytidine1409-2'-O)-methyltransferase
MRKQRLDLLLVDLGLFPTFSRAQAAVMAGLVRVDGQVEDKPGHQVPADAVVELAGPPHPYVSRGGVKLAGALDAFELDVSGCVALDLGASTGGFTDCLLQRGATRVYAVDVGRGQLDQRLRADPRVVSMEGVNARNLTPDDLPDSVDLVAVDVSFISLTKILPAVPSLLTDNALGAVALVKPQFEAGREAVCKGGVVRDPAVWRECMERVARTAAELGLEPVDVSASPIRGPKGNVEFFLLLRPGARPPATPPISERIEAVVKAAEMA